MLNVKATVKRKRNLTSLQITNWNFVKLTSWKPGYLEIQRNLIQSTSSYNPITLSMLWNSHLTHFAGQGHELCIVPEKSSISRFKTTTHYPASVSITKMNCWMGDIWVVMVLTSLFVCCVKSLFVRVSSVCWNNSEFYGFLEGENDVHGLKRNDAETIVVVMWITPLMLF